jgi:uncharacterized protein (TIGR02453 family)
MTDAATFPGFGARAFTWFRGLERDNSKAWFDAHRDQYLAEVRDPLELLLEELADEFGGRVRMFRQNRDVRFSADKSPYKTATYGVIADREQSVGALYCQVSTKGLYAGAGLHQFAPDQLERYREAVDADGPGERLTAIVDDLRSAGHDVGWSVLKTAPRGYARDHPRVELLRHKSLWLGRQLGPGRGITRDRALDHARAVFHAAAPLERWIKEHVGRTELPPDESRGPRRRRRHQNAASR